MKLTRATTSIIIAAAVLLAAYAIGLVIRSARPSRTVPKPVSNQPLPKQTTRLTEEERKKIKDSRAEKLQESRNMTETQKEQFREKVEKSLTPPEQPDANRPAGRANRPSIRTRVSAVQPLPADANNAKPPAPGDTPPQNGKGNASTQDANSSK
jgi:hypothetical protein